MLRRYDTADGHLGPRKKGQTLDRVDPDGNYEPWNLQWESIHGQNQNRRNTRQNREAVALAAQRDCLCNPACPGPEACPEALFFGWAFDLLSRYLDREDAERDPSTSPEPFTAFELPGEEGASWLLGP